MIRSPHIQKGTMKNFGRRQFILGSSISAITAAAVFNGSNPAYANSTPGIGVIPAFQSWTTGPTPTTYTSQSRILIDSANGAELAPDADTLAIDLEQLTGIKPVIRVSTRGQAKVGDVFLSTSISTSDAGKIANNQEGYKFEIDGFFAITGLSRRGVFAGTRSLLQLLTQSLTIKGGEAYDWPLFTERGVRIDPVPRTYSIDWWGNLIRELSYFKLNMLQTLLIGGYALTAEETAAIRTVAKRYHIEFIPTLALAGHADPLLDQYPELELYDSTGRRPGTGRSVDYSKLAFGTSTNPVQSYLDRYINASDSDYFHISGDEFIAYPGWPDNDPNGNWSMFPQLASFAREKVGPGAQGRDGYIWYMNWLNSEIKARGKKMRLWNDSLENSALIKLNPDIVVEFWYQSVRRDSMKARDVADKSKTLNVREDVLYHNMQDPNIKLDARKIYDQFDPYEFHLGASIPAYSRGNVLGAMIAVWMLDAGKNYPMDTNEQLFDLLNNPLKSLAQKTWGSTKPGGYDAFAAIPTGHAPGLIQTSGRIVGKAAWFKDGSASLSRTKQGNLEFSTYAADGMWRSQSIVGNISGDPVTEISAGQLVFAAKTTNNDLLIGRKTPVGWSYSTPIRGIADNPAIILDGEGNAVYFVRKPNSELWSGSIDSTPQLISSGIAKTPAVLLDAKKRLSWYAITTQGNLRQGQQTNEKLWKDSGADLVIGAVGQPAVSLDVSGKSTLFVRKGNGDLVHRWQSSPGGDWDPLIFTLLTGAAGDPQVALDVDKKLTLFIRMNNNEVVHRWQETPGKGWNQINYVLGSRVVSDPAIIMGPDKKLAMFTIGADGNLNYRAQKVAGGGWADSELVFSGLYSMPALVLSGTQLVYLAIPPYAYLIRGWQNPVAGENRWARWVAISS